MARVIVFDVNETLLDLNALNPIFTRIFGDTAIRREWFQQLLQSALVSIVTSSYRNFGAIGVAALDMVAEAHGLSVSDNDRQSIREGMETLPPHPDVREGLDRLRAAGLRLATLTNSTAKVGEAQITNAGLRGYFEQLLSADDVQRLKPAPEPYRMAAKRLGIDIADMRMVAAHAWDITGALRAGCAGAFIARPGKVLDPIAPRPDIVGANLTEVADAIIQVDV